MVSVANRPPPDVSGRLVSKTCAVGDRLRLRPIEEHDLTHLVLLLWDPEAPGEYQWFGFRIDKVRDIERRWRDDGLMGEDSSFLAVELEDGTCAGWVTWRAVARSTNFEIGIALFPGHRGHGIGTQAQRQLVSYVRRHHGEPPAGRYRAGQCRGAALA